MNEEQRHLKSLDEAIAELAPLAMITAAPASVQCQYVGTIIENTLVMLTGVANSLDRGQRSITFSDFSNWISAMQAVHRSFYSSIIIAVEISLVVLCRDENIEVKSARIAQAESIIGDLGDSVSQRTRKRIMRLAGGNPAFMDYVRAVASARIVDSDRRTMWINFFEALNILRNKASHSDSSLSENQRVTLVRGGCEVLVSNDGELQFNSRNYKQLVEFVLRFYQEIGVAPTN
jgi:hypothetical protein